MNTTTATTTATNWKSALRSLEAAGHRPAPSAEALLRQYLEEAGGRYTVGTFLHYALKGKAKVYSQRYYHRVTTRLTTLVQAGVVKEVPSARGRVSYGYAE